MLKLLPEQIHGVTRTLTGFKTLSELETVVQTNEAMKTKKVLFSDLTFLCPPVGGR